MSEPSNESRIDESLKSILDSLREWFDVEFTVVDTSKRDVLHASESPPIRMTKQVWDVASSASKLSTTQIDGVHSPHVMAAVPIRSSGSDSIVALGVFLIREPANDDDFTQINRLLAIDTHNVHEWVAAQTLWPIVVLQRMSNLALDKINGNQRQQDLENENELLSAKLVDSFEEISVVYDIMENLGCSKTPEQLAVRVLDWLVDTLRAETIIIQLADVAVPISDGALLPTSSGEFLCAGKPSIDKHHFARIVEEYGRPNEPEPYVFNASDHESKDVIHPNIRHLILAPVCVHDRVFGWAAAINHSENEWFGTVQARLLRVVARTIGIRALLHEVDWLRQVAEESHVAKSSFLANVSHEFRTPLNAIIGFTNLMQQQPGSIDGDEHLDYLQTIDSSAHRLLDLINDILEFSKLEVGSISVEKIPCVVRDVVTRVISELSCRADDKGIILNATSSTRTLKLINSDPTRLKQLLKNLVGNAIKFTEHGSVQIHTDVVCANDQARYRIEIRDTGIGIPKDKLAKIFDPFVQADESLTRHHGGLGLGLALCKRLAESLDGQLSVRSEVGRGSIFMLEFAGQSIWNDDDDCELSSSIIAAPSCTS